MRLEAYASDSFIKYRIKRFCSTLFLAYLISVIYVTLFTFNYYVYGKSVNLVMFDSIKLMLRSHEPILILKNILGNLVLFFPYGFFLPLFFRPFRRFLPLMGLAILSSLIIEICQYAFAERIFDVDDLLLNTIGAIIGWMTFKSIKGLSRKI